MYKFYCSMWNIEDSFDIENDPIDNLTRLYRVKVDRDYHGRYSYCQMSLYSYISHLPTMLELLSRTENILYSYRNAETNGTVVHDLMFNPNPESYFLVQSGMYEDEFIDLCNITDNHGRKPIELCRNMEIFKDLITKTQIDLNIFRKLVDIADGFGNYFLEALHSINAIVL